MNKKFIVIEGIDGSGKSSIAKLLSQRLTHNGEDTICIKSPIGDFQNWSDFINNSCKPLSHYLFYLAGMVHTSEFVEKALINTHVICDRYIFSTQAYHIAQGVTPIINIDDLKLVMPDYTFYLNVHDESVRRKRISSRVIFEKGDEEIYSKGSLLERIDQQFKNFDLVEIDNTYGTINDAVSEIISKIQF